MNTKKEYWEMKIIDALPAADELHSFLAADIYNDGKHTMFYGGRGGLFWCRPDTLEKGVIAQGFFHVGLAAEDIDGDGVKEIIASEQDMVRGTFRIICFKPGENLSMPWRVHILDPYCSGNPHDIIFADIDGDSETEMIAVACYSTTPGMFLYKRRVNPYEAWDKHQVMAGYLTEGIKVADLDNDGKMEIVSGPDWYHIPDGGPYSGLWERKVYAPNFRDMCRIALVDITGNGRLDIVAIESEYVDGQFSWFENRIKEDPLHPFVEHRIGDCFVYAHSIQAWKEKNEVKIMIAEMAEGGWNQPYNFDARIMFHKTDNNGASWKQEMIYYGQGTHQAMMYDIDNDGELEIVTKTWQHPIVQIFKKPLKPSVFTNVKHSFVDRDKTLTAIDIFACDIDGDGVEDIVCGKWWYKVPEWEKHEIPNIYQAIAVADIDGDSKNEVIAIKKIPGMSDFYSGLSSDLWWLKPVDAENNAWEEHYIGKGHGAWPHGSVIAPVMPDGRLGLALAYHSGKEQDDYPEIYTVPQNPMEPWKSSCLAKMCYAEELVCADIDGDGLLDIVTATHWLRNKGDGTFEPNRFTEEWDGARIAVADINGDGLPDIIVVDETADYDKKFAFFGKVVWFENPGKDQRVLWKAHIIDTIRSPHSLSVCDIDGDGEDEIITAEHNPFKPYRSRSRLMVYKKGDPKGLSWTRYMLDDRFEQHNGAKVIKLKNGHYGIISHGWIDSQFVHLWEILS